MADEMISAKEQHEQLLSDHDMTGGNKSPEITDGLNKICKEKVPAEQTRAIHRQVFMVILANVGVISTGLALALPTVTLNQLTNNLDLVHLTGTQFSWFASINSLSAPLGGLLSSLLLDRIGRKRTLYALNLLGIMAWTLLATPSTTNCDYFNWQLQISRFIIGIVMGLASAPAGIYAAEISIPRIRGRLILGTSISVSLGILILYCIGYFIRNNFRLIALICCGYQIVALLCILPLPESHSWLLSKKRLEEAKESINYFRGLERLPHITHPEVMEEFNILQESLQLRDGEKKPSFLNCLRLPEVYKPLLILMGLFAFQQFSGIFVVIVYAVQISQEAGVSIDPFMCAVLIGTARVLTTIPVGYVLEEWGRRRSGLISTFGMTVSMLVMAGCDWFEVLKSVPYLPVIAVISFIVLSTLGLYTLPFIMISELFPQKVRGPASGLTVAVGTFFTFLSIKLYPNFKLSIGTTNTFIFFGLMSTFAMIFIYWVLPETRGRSLLEIEEQFRNAKKHDTRTEQEMQEVFLH